MRQYSCVMCQTLTICTKQRRRQCEESWAGAQDLWNSHGSHLFNTEGRTQYTTQLTHTGPAPQIKARSTEQPMRQLIGGWDFEEEYHICACHDHSQTHSEF